MRGGDIVILLGVRQRLFLVELLALLAVELYEKIVIDLVERALGDVAVLSVVIACENRLEIGVGVAVGDIGLFYLGDIASFSSSVSLTPSSSALLSIACSLMTD